MPDIITLKIPLKPHLKKYLNHKFGETHSVSKRSWLGGYFVDLLDKQYRKTNVDIPKDEYYQISISSSIIKEVGFDISAVKLKRLADMIHKVFLNDLYSYIEVSVGSDLKFYNEDHDSINKQNSYRAIGQFLMFHGITEDDISVESLYKGFYRYKKADKEEVGLD